MSNQEVSQNYTHAVISHITKTDVIFPIVENFEMLDPINTIGGQANPCYTSEKLRIGTLQVDIRQPSFAVDGVAPC